MTDLVHPSFGRVARSRETAQAAIRYASAYQSEDTGQGFGGFVWPATSRLVEDSEGNLASGALGAFAASTTGLDVTLESGEALVGGGYLARDVQTVVTMDGSVGAEQSLAVGWQDGLPNEILVGVPNSSVGDAFTDDDPRIELYSVEATATDIASITPTARRGAIDAPGAYPFESPDIAANAIGSEEIAGGAVSSPQIADGSIEQVDLAGNSVGSAEIRDNSVGQSELNDPVPSAAIRALVNFATGDEFSDYPIGAVDISDVPPFSTTWQTASASVAGNGGNAAVWDPASPTDFAGGSVQETSENDHLRDVQVVIGGNTRTLGAGGSQETWMGLPPMQQVEEIRVTNSANGSQTFQVQGWW